MMYLKLGFIVSSLRYDFFIFKNLFYYSYCWRGYLKSFGPKALCFFYLYSIVVLYFCLVCIFCLCCYLVIGFTMPCDGQCWNQISWQTYMSSKDIISKDTTFFFYFDLICFTWPLYISFYINISYFLWLEALFNTP